MPATDGPVNALTPPMSALSLGVMTFGDQVTDVGEATRMVDMARDAGVTCFDTADAYHRGASEELLSKALGGARDEVIIASKVGQVVDDDPAHRGLSRRWMRESIEGTLRRLDTDHVDLYYLHVPDYTVPLAESLETLSELVDEGKVRVPAVSNHAAWQLAQIDCLTDTNGWHRIGVSQVLYNIMARRLEDEYVAYAKQAGLASVAYNPLAGGLLTGKHQLDAPVDSGRFTNPQYRDRYWHAQEFQAVEELGRVAEEAGLSLLELSLRWVLSRDVIDSVLLGASSPEQLQANLAACAGGALPADVLERCEDVWPVTGGTAPRYNR